MPFPSTPPERARSPPRTAASRPAHARRTGWAGVGPSVFQYSVDFKEENAPVALNSDPPEDVSKGGREQGASGQSERGVLSARQRWPGGGRGGLSGGGGGPVQNPETLLVAKVWFPNTFVRKEVCLEKGSESRGGT